MLIVIVMSKGLFLDLSAAETRKHLVLYICTSSFLDDRLLVVYCTFNDDFENGKSV